MEEKKSLLFPDSWELLPCNCESSPPEKFSAVASWALTEWLVNIKLIFGIYTP